MIQKNKSVLAPENKLNDQLIETCKNCDLGRAQQLISCGADINFVHRTDVSSWYTGNTHTPLSYAVAYSFKKDEENKYIEMVEFLLNNGADVKFETTIGTWGRAGEYSIFL